MKLLGIPNNLPNRTAIASKKKAVIFFSGKQCVTFSFCLLSFQQNRSFLKFNGSSFLISFFLNFWKIIKGTNRRHTFKNVAKRLNTIIYRTLVPFCVCNSLLSNKFSLNFNYYLSILWQFQCFLHDSIPICSHSWDLFFYKLIVSVFKKRLAIFL